MRNEPIWTREDEADCGRLSPLVKRACSGSPAPEALMTIAEAAARAAARRSLFVFPGLFLYAAAALLALMLAGWLAIRPTLQAQRSVRLASVLDDAMFLCTEDGETGAFPALGQQDDLARRLLTLQGLDTVTTPVPEAEEPVSPLSKESQSRNRTELLAQRCG